MATGDQRPVTPIGGLPAGVTIVGPIYEMQSVGFDGPVFTRDLHKKGEKNHKINGQRVSRKVFDGALNRAKHRKPQR